MARGPIVTDAMRSACFALALLLTGPVSPSGARAQGFPDQVNDPVTYSGFDCSFPPEERVRLYQSFTPARPILSAVELRVLAFSGFAGKSVRIQIIEDSPDGRVRGEATAVVPVVPQVPFTSALIRFDFMPPITTRPGSEYFITWMGRDPSFWVGSPVDTYPRGRVYTCTGEPWQPSIDMNFITYAEPAAGPALSGRFDHRHRGFLKTDSTTPGSRVSGPTWGSLKVLYR